MNTTVNFCKWISVGRYFCSSKHLNVRMLIFMWLGKPFCRIKFRERGNFLKTLSHRAKKDPSINYHGYDRMEEM